MLPRAFTIAILGLAAACAAPSRAVCDEPAAPAPPAADRAAIDAVLQDQAAAWNRGDLAGYMDGYARSDALVFTSGGKVRRGWQTAFDHYRARYAADPAAMGKLVFEVDSIDLVGRDAAVALGRWILTNSPSDGRGVFSVVFQRRPEGWRIVHDHTSVGPAE